MTLFAMLAASRSSGSAALAPDWASQLAPVLGPALAQQVQQIGGDEFVIVLNRLGAEDETLAQIARQLLERVGEPLLLDGGQVASIGASLGIACFPRHGGTRKQLLHAADAAMYEVKRFGKNSFAMALEPPVVT